MEAHEIRAVANWMQKVTDQTQEERFAFEGEIHGATEDGNEFVLTFAEDRINLEVRT